MRQLFRRCSEKGRKKLAVMETKCEEGVREKKRGEKDFK